MPKSDENRVFRVKKTSPAGILMEDKAVSIVGDSRHFITVDDRGITFKGPISHISDSLSRRTAGLFTGINDFLEMIPQTIITPVPSKIPNPPIYATVNMTQDIAFFMAMLV